MGTRYDELVFQVRYPKYKDKLKSCRWNLHYLAVGDAAVVRRTMTRSASEDTAEAVKTPQDIDSLEMVWQEGHGP